MNWKLIFTLSVFSIATILLAKVVLPAKFVWWFLGAIFFLCAGIVGKRSPNRYFLHGFYIGLASGTGMALFEFFLFDRLREAIITMNTGSLPLWLMLPLDSLILGLG